MEARTVADTDIAQVKAPLLLLYATELTTLILMPP
jgi:hypothetical protein